MEDEKPTPKKFIRNCDTPLIDELGDVGGKGWFWGAGVAIGNFT